MFAENFPERRRFDDLSQKIRNGFIFDQNELNKKGKVGSNRFICVETNVAQIPFGEQRKNQRRQMDFVSLQ